MTIVPPPAGFALRRATLDDAEAIVVGDGPTGARRLYEAIGMRTAYAFEIWEKELRR